MLLRAGLVFSPVLWPPEPVIQTCGLLAISGHFPYLLFFMSLSFLMYLGELFNRPVSLNFHLSYL